MSLVNLAKLLQYLNDIIGQVIILLNAFSAHQIVIFAGLKLETCNKYIYVWVILGGV